MSDNSINSHIGIIIGFFFTMLGSCYATIKSAKFIDLEFKKFIPIVMANILSIYNIIIIIVISVNKLGDVDPNIILSATTIMGIGNMFSGITMGNVCAMTNEYSIGLVIAIIFSESFAIFGLIIALLILS